MRLRRRPVVLAYHGVDHVAPEADPNRLVVTPERLEAHVRLLQRRGYRFHTAGELLERWGGAEPPPGTAVLTFDDGFRDWLEIVAPLLERLGVRASFYVCPDWWGGQHAAVAGAAGRLLTAAEARMLHDRGMELGSHTLTHPDLRALGDAALAHELVASREAIEALTGTPCRTLAYPFGLFDERVERAAAAAGYALAFDWLPGPWRALAAPRLPAPPRHGAGRLALKLTGLRRPGR